MKTRQDKIEFANNRLKIFFRDYGKIGRNYSELFDFLGDFDKVTASEIGANVIVMSGDIYFFTLKDESKLQKNSVVEIERQCLLEEFIDVSNQDHLDFFKWYNKDYYIL
jgi:hypothetical protein